MEFVLVYQVQDSCNEVITGLDKRPIIHSSVQDALEFRKDPTSLALCHERNHFWNKDREGKFSLANCDIVLFEDQF